MVTTWMPTISAQLLMVIAKANNYQVLTGDIKNAYLYADCNINICTQIGPEFELAGFKELKTGSMAKVEKALYGLPSSGQNWHSHLAGTLQTLGFTPARYNQDVFTHQNKADSGYDYIGCHTDDLLILADNAQKILDSLMKIYVVSNPGPPVYHLGCDYSKVSDEGEEFWCIGSSTHTKEALVKAEEILSRLYNIQGNKIKLKTKKCEKILILADSHPEMDEGDLLNKDGHYSYQHLIGILQWLCTIGRADIQFSVCSLS